MFHLLLFIMRGSLRVMVKKLLLGALLLSNYQPVLCDETDGTSLYKKMRFEVSLGYTQLTSTGWWSEIEPYRIYLGALPLKNKGNLEEILALGVTRVLSLVENFELEDGWFNKTVKPAEWREKGVQVHQISAVDYAPLTSQQIEEGVAFLADQLANGETVYVHCKAGRGRSAAIVIAYLMQYQGFTLDDAIAFVKERRPQINLNQEQRQALVTYFDIAEEKPADAPGYLAEVQEVTQEALAKALGDMLEYVIDGVSYDASSRLPQSIAGYVPAVSIQSTLERRNRYLRECRGDQDLAIKTAIERNHGMKHKLKTALPGLIPFVGSPTSYSIAVWHQLREIALIASLYGHDVHDPEVKKQCLASLIDGNVMKIPAQTIDILAKEIVKKILVKVGVGYIPGAAIPAHLLYNYFTDNSAKVSTYAIKRFGGEFAKPIDKKDYE